MSLTRTFLAASGRISADNRTIETDATRGIGEALGRAEDDPTAISLDDYRGEDGAGVNSSNQTTIIPPSSPISFSDLYGLTSKVTEITVDNTTSSRYTQELYRSTSYYTRWDWTSFYTDCDFWCDTRTGFYESVRYTTRRYYRNTATQVSKTTQIASLEPHRPRPFYRKYIWTFAGGVYRLTERRSNG